MRLSQITLFFLLVTITGCAGSHCIKLGGNYQGIDGDIEYCFSQEKTEKNGLPTTETNEVLVDESVLEKLLSKAEGPKPLENKSLKARLEEAVK